MAHNGAHKPGQDDCNDTRYGCVNPGLDSKAMDIPGLSLDPSNQWGPDYTWALGMWYCVFRLGKLDLLFRISTRDSFETYHLNCHYRLPMTCPLLMAIML